MMILLCFRFDPPSVYLHGTNLNKGRKRTELALAKIYNNTNAALHELLINYQVEQEYFNSIKEISLIKKKINPLFIGIGTLIISVYHIPTDDWNYMAAVLYYSDTISQPQP